MKERIECDFCGKVFEGKEKYSNYYGLLYWVNDDGKIVGMRYDNGMYVAYLCRSCLENSKSSIKNWFEGWRKLFEK